MESKPQENWAEIEMPSDEEEGQQQRPGEDRKEESRAGHPGPEGSEVSIVKNNNNNRRRPQLSSPSSSLKR